MAKNYYGVYFIKDKSTFILEDKNELNLQTYGRSNLCRKFSTKEEAKEWLKQVKEQEKNLSPDNKSERYYAIYYVKTNIFDIVTSPEEAQKLRKGKHNLSKKFSSKEKAEEWFKTVKDKKENILLNIKKEVYYAILFLDNFYSLITNDNEEKDRIILNRKYVLQSFNCELECKPWIRIMKDYYKKNYNCFFNMIQLYFLIVEQVEV